MSSATKILQLMLAMAVMSPATYAADNTSQPSTIEVFTTSAIGIVGQDYGAEIFEIDGLDALARELSDGLPTDPAEAQQQALQRISELGDALRRRAGQATEGLSRAQRYGIKKIPAVVFDDGRSVIYGLTDLNQAIEIYRQGAKP